MTTYIGVPPRYPELRQVSLNRGQCPPGGAMHMQRVTCVSIKSEVSSDTTLGTQLLPRDRPALTDLYLFPFHLRRPLILHHGYNEI